MLWLQPDHFTATCLNVDCNILHFSLRLFLSSALQLEADFINAFKDALAGVWRRRAERWSRRVAGCQGALVQVDADIYSSFNEMQLRRPCECPAWVMERSVLRRLGRERFFSSWLSLLCLRRRWYSGNGGLHWSDYLAQAQEKWVSAEI